MEEPKRYSCGNGEGMFDNENGYWISYKEHLIIVNKLLREQLAIPLVSNSLPKTQEEIDQKLIEWCKGQYSQGDDYYTRKTKKGLNVVGYSNDSPLQHGHGKEYILNDIDYLKIVFGYDC